MIGTTFTDMFGTWTVVSEPRPSTFGPVVDVTDPDGTVVVMYVEAVERVVQR